MTRFMPISLRPFELTTGGGAYRSHSTHQTLKHCIESTFLDGSASYHIGFSPFSKKRHFISMERINEEQILFYQWRSDGDDNQYYVRYKDSNGQIITQLYIPPDEEDLNETEES